MDDILTMMHLEIYYILTIFINIIYFSNCQGDMKRLSAAIRLCWLAAIISQIHAEVRKNENWVMAIN